MALEIEKRYLLKRLPNVKKYDKVYEITQIYCDGVRYRSQHDVIEDKTMYIKTIKTPVTEGVVNEEENQITPIEYTEAIDKAQKIIRKTRRIKYIGKRKWEIDEFIDIKLIIAEVEVENVKELSQVKIPKFLQDVVISDITGIRQLSNFNLADPI